MAEVQPPSAFENAIKHHVEDSISALIETEIEAAQDRVEEGIRKIAADMALSVMKNYNMHIDRNELVIKVRLSE